MGLIKLAVYGALGYLAYQMFFTEGGNNPFGGGSGGGGSSRGSRQGARSRGGRSSGGGSQSFGGVSSGAQMTGGGEGRVESTQEPSGTSMSHRVGRGVIS